MPRAAPLLLMLLLALPARAGVFHPASTPAHARRDIWLFRFDSAVPPERAGVEARRLLAGRGELLRTWQDALVGFLARIEPEDARALSAHPLVLGAWQDVWLPDAFSTPIPDCSMGVVQAPAAVTPVVPETLTCGDPDPQNAAGVCTDNWGLDRLDQAALPRDQRYAPPRLGTGVHIFLVDSGLYSQHQDFAGRVGLGTDATGSGGTPDDCPAWSHGTHVAGIAAGSRFGVAKGATLHPVRIAPCPLSIALSSLVTAYDWITQAHGTTVVGPAVASMSLNSTAQEFLDPTQPLGVAIAGTLADGVLVINSAGNNAEDACGHAVAVPGALIVGGADEHDQPWTRRPGDPNYAAWCGTDCGSNTGACVHLFAPSAHIVSAWLGSPADPRNACRLSGTSMAAPHAAGAAALVLEANPTATPAQVKQALVGRALAVMSNLPAGSPNRLLTVLEGVPRLSVAPGQGLAFGVVGVGTTAAAQRVTLSSTGTTPVTVGTLSLSGAQAAEFRLTQDGCSGRALAVGATCTAELTFSPVAAGLRSTTLVLPSDDAVAPAQALSVSGVGDQARVTVTLAGAGQGRVTSRPSGVDCGGSCSAPFVGGTPVTLEATPAAGSRLAGFAGPAGCAGQVCAFTAAGSQTVTVSFEPVPPVDAGTPPADGGRPDAGGADSDGGAPGLDAGNSPPDAGGATGPGQGLGAHHSLHADAVGCGCGAGASAAPVLAIVLALALSRRRQRRAVR